MRILTAINTKNLATKLVFLVALILLGLMLSYVATVFDFDQSWIDHIVKSNGIIGVLYFLLSCALVTACGLPRQFAAFLGGYAFGTIDGTLLSTIGTTFGCVISFYFARIVARNFVETKFPGKSEAINNLLLTKTFTKTIIIRFLPVGSNLITNLVAGISKVSGKKFFCGSFVGYLPQMYIFSLAGSGVVILSFWRIALSIVLFIISTLISYYLYKQHKLSTANTAPTI